MTEPLLEVSDLHVHFAVGRTMFSNGVTIKAVNGVSFTVGRGEVVGLIGESGSGKTTLGRSILRLTQPTSGRVRFEGHDVTTLDRARMKALRSRMQIIFQDPYASLNPRMSVGDVLGEALYLHGIGSRHDRQGRIIDLLGKVGLPANAATRFPHEFSGGQRQRIAIARALAVEPELLVLDEPTSALDVSIQQQVLALLVHLQKTRKLSYLLITHDLAVMRAMAHRVIVMKSGRVVEAGDTLEVLHAPSHPYTRSLLASSLLMARPDSAQTPRSVND
jgi:ABC-type microcin C transport system duplicated ATPase subunit YejF